jgi:dipeptidyl aminopeptidase/acylaminoacyl peptidase
MKIKLPCLIFLVCLLSACAATPQPSPVVNTSLPSETPIPSATATPQPSETPQPTATPARSATFTITPTLFPLTIAALRQRDYPGSDLVIEQTLDPGPNYNRYIVSYQSDGLKLYALLTVPRGQKPATGWPVIIFNHGYIPPAAYTPTGNYVAHVDILSRAGYIVLKPDYRGHWKSAGTAPGGYSTPDYIVDDLNALASIKRFKDADPNRIGMFGHSMGGHITMGAMVISKDIKAGVIWAGVVASYPDLLDKWFSTPPATLSDGAMNWRSSFVQEFGSPADNPAFWASISPITYVGDLSGPLQLHHGTKDSEVPYQFSVELDAAVKAAGKTVEFYTYPGADHNLLNADFNNAIYRTLKFFDQYVKDSNP